VSGLCLDCLECAGNVSGLSGMCVECAGNVSGSRVGGPSRLGLTLPGEGVGKGRGKGRRLTF
jgi:hypothetical protein